MVFSTWVRIALRRQRALKTLRAHGIENGLNVESAAVTVVRSLPDINWLALHGQNALETVWRPDGGRMSISQEHSPRVSKMVPLLCRTSKVSHEGCCVSSYRNWLHRLVRLCFSFFGFYLVRKKIIRSEEEKLWRALEKVDRSTDEWAALHSAYQALGWARSPSSYAPPYGHVVRYLYPNSCRKWDIPSI